MHSPVKVDICSSERPIQDREGLLRAPSFFSLFIHKPIDDRLLNYEKKLTSNPARSLVRFTRNSPETHKEKSKIKTL